MILTHLTTSKAKYAKQRAKNEPAEAGALVKEILR